MRMARWPTVRQRREAAICGVLRENGGEITISIFGKVTFVGDDDILYDDADAFLDCIREELPYNGNGDSYGVSSCDIQRFFRDIWECSHRLKDVALENKDFESIITTHNDPQTTVYCDPPYYEAERYAVEFPRSDHQRLHDVLAQHTGFAMVSYNNCDYIRRLYEDFFIYEVERPNSQSKKKNDIYREYIMTNYDPRVFASQMTIFGDYSSNGKICRLVHIPERPLRT